MSPRVRSSVNDPWVFRAEKPADLLGDHADLIEAAREPGEPLEYLLYAPIYFAEGGPFGIRGTAASHGLAVTRTRFIISADPMVDGVAPSVQAIPFERILAIEIGAALGLGWLVVRAAGREAVASTVVFFRASGIRHFRAAARAYRSLASRRALLGPDCPSWDDVWKRTPPYLEHEARPLILEGEHPGRFLRTRERWADVRPGRRPTSTRVSPEALFLATDKGFLWCVSEPPTRSDALGFGVNVTCLARGPHTTAKLDSTGDNPVAMSSLQLSVGAFRLTLTLDEDTADGAIQLVRWLETCSE